MVRFIFKNLRSYYRSDFLFIFWAWDVAFGSVFGEAQQIVLQPSWNTHHQFTIFNPDETMTFTSKIHVYFVFHPSVSITIFCPCGINRGRRFLQKKTLICKIDSCNNKLTSFFRAFASSCQSKRKTQPRGLHTSSLTFLHFRCVSSWNLSSAFPWGSKIWTANWNWEPSGR